MKKETIIGYAKNQLRNYKRQLNALEGETKTAMQEAIDDLTAFIAELESDNTAYTTEEALKAMEDRIEEKIKALAEKVETSENPAPAAAENYLKSNNALHDFASAIRASKNDATAFRKAWGESLSKNGVSAASGSAIVFPEIVNGLIVDAWEKKSWLNGLKNTGATRYRVRFNTSSQDATSSRAKGHTAGNTKTEQEIVLNHKDVETQFIYKLQSLDNITIFEDDGELVRYIVDELTTQWVYEVEKAILVGDGRANGNDKINKVESILRANSDTFVEVDTHVAGASKLKELRALRDKMSENAGRVVAFMKRSVLTEMAEFLYAAGGATRYSTDAEIAAQIGVDEIICTNCMGASAEAILLNMNGYVTVGKFAPDFVQWEDYLTNTQYYRIEAPFGGAMEMPKGAAVLKPAAE